MIMLLNAAPNMLANLEKEYIHIMKMLKIWKEYNEENIFSPVTAYHILEF